MRSTNTGIPETLGTLLAAGADALTGAEAVDAAKALATKPNDVNNTSVSLCFIILKPFSKNSSEF